MRIYGVQTPAGAPEMMKMCAYKDPQSATDFSGIPQGPKNRLEIRLKNGEREIVIKCALK